MEVNGPNSIGNTGPIKPDKQPGNIEKAAEHSSVQPKDEVEISNAGKMLNQLNQSSELHSERLAQIKAEIEAETYETADKLEAAMERLLGEIGFKNE
jgi:anti-sigma28 factor (negative regulator of flagellin synthesis)